MAATASNVIGETKEAKVAGPREGSRPVSKAEIDAELRSHTIPDYVVDNFGNYGDEGSSVFSWTQIQKQLLVYQYMIDHPEWASDKLEKIEKVISVELAMQMIKSTGWRAISCYYLHDPALARLLQLSQVRANGSLIVEIAKHDYFGEEALQQLALVIQENHDLSHQQLDTLFNSLQNIMNKRFFNSTIHFPLISNVVLQIIQHQGFNINTITDINILNLIIRITDTRDQIIAGHAHLDVAGARILAGREDAAVLGALLGNAAVNRDPLVLAAIARNVNADAAALNAVLGVNNVNDLAIARHAHLDVAGARILASRGDAAVLGALLGNAAVNGDPQVLAAIAGNVNADAAALNAVLGVNNVNDLAIARHAHLDVAGARILAGRGDAAVLGALLGNAAVNGDPLVLAAIARNVNADAAALNAVLGVNNVNDLAIARHAHLDVAGARILASRGDAAVLGALLGNAAVNGDPQVLAAIAGNVNADALAAGVHDVGVAIALVNHTNRPEVIQAIRDNITVNRNHLVIEVLPPPPLAAPAVAVVPPATAQPPAAPAQQQLVGGGPGQAILYTAAAAAAGVGLGAVAAPVAPAFLVPPIPPPVQDISPTNLAMQASLRY